MYRAITLSVALMATTILAEAEAQLPSFPGAEGFGAIATGGRGGQVIKVTTLASSGPGSLQEALATSGPRIIVFEVSGVIHGDHVITKSDVTIAGQTAPGAGITIAGRLSGAYTYSVQNIVIRHIRVRPTYNGSTPGQQFDAMQFSRNSRIMIDHVSVSWGVDETVDLYEADDVTVQWSTISESATTGHPEGMHNYGLISGPDGHRVSVHHNLFAHHKNRCPAVANGPASVRNNVIYNVRHGFVHHNPASGQFNIVGNTYIQGPNNSLIPFYFDDEAGGAAPGLAYHLSDNFIDDPGDYVGLVENPWAQPFLHPSFSSLYLPGSYYASAPFDFSWAQAHYHPVVTQPPAQAEALVLAHAGAFPRDVVTSRVLDEVTTRTGSWGVHAPNDLLQGLTVTTPPIDADGDGMADGWEVLRGLNPSNGADHSAIMPSGYTAIEEYINELADALSGQGVPPPNGGGDAGEGGATGEGGAAGGEGGAGGESETVTGGGSEDGGGGATSPIKAGKSQGIGKGLVKKTTYLGDFSSEAESSEMASCSFGASSGASRFGWVVALGLGACAVRRSRRKR